MQASFLLRLHCFFISTQTEKLESDYTNSFSKKLVGFLRLFGEVFQCVRRIGQAVYRIREAEASASPLPSFKPSGLEPSIWSLHTPYIHGNFNKVCAGGRYKRVEDGHWN